MADTVTPAKAPTVAIGYTQAPSYSWYYDAAETTPELQWPFSIQVYDQMRRTDAQCKSVLQAVTLPLRRTPWRIDPNGARDEVVRFVADDLGLPIAGENEVRPPLRSKGRFSWLDHLRLSLLMLPFGHAYFEQLYRINDEGTRAHLAKLEYRPPSTIERIEVASDGGLVYIQQYWAPRERKPEPIPVNRLVAYIHEREGGNWLGTSILRAAYKNWLLKDRLLRVQAQTVERNGMGIPDYEAAETEVSLAAGLALTTNLRAGEAAGVSRPSGSKLRLMGVDGTLPDADKPIRYHDEQIARAVLAHFLNLGSDNGSYALGATLGDFFILSLQTVAQQIADTTTDHVIEDLVDVNWGPDEPAPRLCFDEIGSRQQATAEALKSLVDAGILHPDEPLEGATRQFYGLPPADPATATPAPGQPVGETPAPETQTGEYSVAASAKRRRKRRAVRAKFDPAEPRDDHGRWSLAGEVLQALSKYGKVLDAAKWGDHDNPKGLHGWISLHDDGDVMLSLRRADGGVEPFMNGADIDQPSEWRELAGNLRDAATAAEANDEDFDPIGASGYDIEVDAQDGTVSFQSDSRPKAGVIAEPDELRSIADASDAFAGHLERYNNGGYDAADSDLGVADVQAPAAEPDTFRPGGDSGSLMDWSVVKKDGSRVLDITGDNGDSIAPWLTPQEFQGLRDALAHAATRGDVDHFYPGGDDDDDQRYFSWSSKTNADGTTHIRLDIADEEGDDVRLTLTPQDMRRWLDAMSATVSDKRVKAARGRHWSRSAWVAAAAGVDTHPGGERLKRMWVFGQLASKWVTWTDLYDHLKKYIKNRSLLKKTVSAWYRLRYGHNPPRHHVAASSGSASEEALQAFAEEFADLELDDEAEDWELAIDALSAALDELSGAVAASTFTEDLHPRAPAGSSTGGQFSSGSENSAKTSQSKTGKATPKAATPKRRRVHRRIIPKGQLGFDGVRGTGYGMPYGDPRVRQLQAELNRLGLLDLHGRKLAVDGKLGPLTTSSIKAAQERLGMRPTGIIDPAFIARLKATKAMPPAPAKPAPKRKRKQVKAKFDPSELRNPDGTWTESPVGEAMDFAERVAKALQGEDALESVPVHLEAASGRHGGHYEGAAFSTAPSGHGDPRAVAEMEGLEYQETNGHLWALGRGDYDPTKDAWGKPLTPERLDRRKARDAETEHRIAEVDKSMAVSPLPHDVVVHRGVKSGSDTFGTDLWMGLTPRVPGEPIDFAREDAEWERFESGWRPDFTGLEWVQHSYLHTTVREDLMSEYAKNVGGSVTLMPVAMRIVLPAGTPAIRMSDMDKEAELMAARGLRLRVVKDHGEDAAGVRHFDVEVVGHEQPA